VSPIFAFFLVGATLVDRIQGLQEVEQKKNIQEYHRKSQYDARMSASKTAIASLTTGSSLSS
jgi:hypothetical protein